ncbi:MAG: Bax inhibitor-1/YccA family protein [Planctomycetota bacterium]|nr:Bax inhibitor-1/YccA family protein [Planctomycetota bacterium]
MRTGNPVLREGVFQNGMDLPRWDELASSKAPAGVMTVRGAAIKSAILLGLCSITAVLAWSAITANAGLLMPLTMGGAVIGLVLGLVMFFWQKGAAFLSPIYAIAQGAFVGGISIIAANYGLQKGVALGAGGVFQAVFITFGIFAAMLMAYVAGIIRLRGVVAKMVIVGTMGVMFAYLATMLLNLFGMQMPYIHDSGPIGIGFSIFVVVLASLNLVLDFQFIEDGAAAGAPKHMEWYAAFGLLATLVWLYIEILRLLSKLRK